MFLILLIDKHYIKHHERYVGLMTITSNIHNKARQAQTRLLELKLGVSDSIETLYKRWV